jgi:hypothetical protein
MVVSPLVLLLGGGALEDDDVEAFEGYGVGWGVRIAGEDVGEG